ncbi:MAG: 4-hydroxythreonine-4-phosphate dehydrogenase PdxA [Hyphomicrobium sp.]|nr:4-hydroxythreonine-4-phosphate dehydrogenase PdxA [Hyphomicrobium sp.]
MAVGGSSGAAPLALTMGDPAGIGLEVTLKAWQLRNGLSRAADALSPFCLYGSAGAVRDRARLLNLDVPVVEIASPADACTVFATALPVLDIALTEPAVAGQPSPRNAAAVISAISRAVGDVHSGQARAVVTNPIAKSVLYSAGFKYPGHTEFLAALAGEHWPGRSYHPVMMIASDELKVIPLTIHVALADVPRLVTGALIDQTVRITAEALQRDFAIATPRIAVAGLNPHAGEDGTIGAEDRDCVIPALDALRANGFDVSGPLSADTMFHAAARATYDAAICMYHDQALIPVKTLAFDRGVNVTLGLPFVRTSPDHGTAFNIAGTGTASAQSLIEALKLADAMSAARAAVAS